MISIVAAVGKNRVIGNKGKIPWDIPEDLEYFEDLTIGSIVVMGRKTFESIGKPLSDRINIVLTKDKKYNLDGCLVANSIPEVFHYISIYDFACGDLDVFVIGGGEIYREFMNFADRLYLTEIDYDFEGDVFFPNFDRKKWNLLFSQKGNNKKYIYSFNIYERTYK